MDTADGRIWAAPALPAHSRCRGRAAPPPTGYHRSMSKRRPDTAGRRRRATPPPPRRARPPAPEPPVVGFVSLGCAKNLVDSEKMLGQIAESGAILSGDESLADTIVVNTCGFLDASRQEALDVLRELAERKRRGRLRCIVVAGCLVQRDGRKLLDAVPEIDALVGVHQRDDVPAAVWGDRRRPSDACPAASDAPATDGAAVAPPARLSLPVASTAGPSLPVASTAGPSLPVAPGGAPAGPRGAPELYLGDYHPQPWSDQGRLRLTPTHYAYVRISEGCNQKCTFCTIPSIRGPMRSKTPDQLVAECRELLADGARELILIGQDTTSYGADLGYEPGLAGLLRTLDAACDTARWLRLMYVYPSVFTDAMIEAIAECERVVKYIDIPLQHINDRMLKAMGRRVTRRQQEELLEKLRRRIPGVAIRTTFIVGFPTETEGEFAELLEFVQSFGFDAVGAFPYSLEPETPAGRMNGHLDPAVRAERYERLMRTQQGPAFAAARRRIGSSFEVVIDAETEHGLVARHAGQAPEVDAVTRLPAGAGRVGDFLTVACVDADGYDLLARPTRMPLRVLR